LVFVFYAWVPIQTEEEQVEAGAQSEHRRECAGTRKGLWLKVLSIPEPGVISFPNYGPAMLEIRRGGSGEVVRTSNR
jgi:hypothetical protein